MDGDDEDFIFFGASIEREEDTSVRKRKAAADAGQLRALPVWKQEVRDEEGRRRFHGAFTGGFSAGYYNTAGSKEGWTPKSFTSSRKNRAEIKKQSIYSFLDEDEKAELDENSLKTSAEFDTFGFTAVELARKHSEEEQRRRPSVIPGPVPDEIVLPAANSIGVKLLLKMGWRHGHSVKDTHRTLHDARREARKAFLAFSGNEEKVEPAAIDVLEDAESVKNKAGNAYRSQGTPEFVLKQDLHGLGYDPFKHAPEFRDRKLGKASNKTRTTGNRATSLRRNIFSSNSGNIAPGFGIGALEELDFEDEDVYDTGFEVEETCLEDIEQPSTESKDTKVLPFPKTKEQSILTGFKPALADCSYKVERFLPPDIPRDFDPKHKFSAPLEAASRFIDPNPPPEVSPPSDNTLRILIEGLATLVSRCGKLFEDLSREKNKDNQLFAFLSGGQGHEYYARMVWEQQQKHIDKKMLTMEMKSSDQKMTAESRGRILGERPLEKSSTKSTHSPMQKAVHFQSNLSDTFTKPSCHSNAELEKPFKEDPAKQERFEQFLKDKFEGGLRSTYPGGSSSLSEADRARERLDFEAALETLQKSKLPMTYDQIPDPNTQFTDAVEIRNNTKSEENILDKMHPKREEFQWRPAPVLCKRFDIIDPFMGKPPPLPRARSRMESLVFTSDFVKTIKTEEAPSVPKPLSSAEVIDKRKDVHATEHYEEPADGNVQKPVDLYKAIFSDDSDVDEGGGGNLASTPVDDPEKTEGANTVLNRLVAGDFLESLGKELGLDAPTDNAHQSIASSGCRGIEGPGVLPNQDKSSHTAKSVYTASGRETSTDGQEKISFDGTKGEVDDPSCCGGATYSGGRHNDTMGVDCPRELENGIDDKVDLRKEGMMMEDHTPRRKQPEDNLDLNWNFPADYNFEDSSKCQAKGRTELSSKRHTIASSGRQSGGRGSDDDSARDRNHKKSKSRSRHRRGNESDVKTSSEEYGSGSNSRDGRNLSRGKLRKHSRHRQDSASDTEFASRISSKDGKKISRGKSRKHSRYHHGSGSDTELSSDGYDGRVGSRSKGSSSRKESRNHSKTQRDKSRVYSRSHSSQRKERSVSEDERESRKSRSHAKDFGSSKSGGYRKHR